MMETQVTADSFLDHFVRLEKNLQDQEPDWLLDLRRNAFASFQKLGLPTIKQENWRYTNLNPLTKKIYSPLCEAVQLSTLQKALHTCLPENLQGARIVMVNGRVQEIDADLIYRTAGIKAGSLREFLQQDANFVQNHLGQIANLKQDALTALNNAFMQDGLILRISKGCILEKPLIVLHLTTTSEKPLLTNPRNLFVLEEQAQASIIEVYAGLHAETSWNNALSEIVLQEQACLDHTIVQQEIDSAAHLYRSFIRQQKDSHYVSHNLSCGGNLVRHETNVQLQGEGASCILEGLYAAKQQQHQDNQTLVDHAASHCTSQQLYKGILHDHARGIFNGKIIVRAQAQKTSSQQTNKNLLLSDKALAHSKPELEINANDVKCSHGSTIGQLDEDAIFYLCSRGISQSAAKIMLTSAFANQILDRLKNPEMRNWIYQRLMAFLDQEKV